MAPDWTRPRSVAVKSGLPSSATSKRSSDGDHAQGVPFAEGNRRLLAGNLAALALFHAIEAH